MGQAYGHALLTCDAIARDPNGKITLYGIFDRIWTASFPIVHPMFCIYWRCSHPALASCRDYCRPDGQTLTELEPAETSKEAPHVMQGTYTLGAFQFPASGEYKLLLMYNSSEVLRSSLHLQQRRSHDD